MFVSKRMIRSSLLLRWMTTKQRSISSSKSKQSTDVAVLPENMPFRQRLFTGIKPSGPLHLGIYLGVIRKWVELQHTKDEAILCIADLHSITTSKDPPTLRENIFSVAAGLLACGVDLEHTTLYVQSAVKHHAELCWILSSISSMTSLGHQPMYAEKTRLSKKVPLGIFVYPVMQASDILLYKSTHVPIGEDQMAHIEYAQNMANGFNSYYEGAFPVCKPVKADYTSKVCDLRDPTKKMSKSNPDTRSTIYLADEPDDIIAKIRDSATDYASDVSYDPVRRIGISNLVGIHANIAGKTPEEAVAEADSMDVAKYKAFVADVIIEHLKPIRQKYNDLMSRRNELIYQLDAGAAKAHVMASETMDELKQRMGLGASATMPRPLTGETSQYEEPTSSIKRNQHRKNYASWSTPQVAKPVIRETRDCYQGLCSLVKQRQKSSGPF